VRVRLLELRPRRRHVRGGRPSQQDLLETLPVTLTTNRTVS
jgi:hypothetical protein